MSITGKPDSLTVRARQKLKTAESAEAFITALQGKLQKHIEANETVAFEDFDISQNPLSYEQFDNLFTTLSTTNVRVERIRLFGMPTLDDSVASLIAQWLESVAPDTCPYELHLSDGALTTAGFESIMAAIEANEAWPFSEPRKSAKIPLYIRFEGNYIEESSIQEKVDAGIIFTFRKQEGQIRSPVAGKPETKVKMLVKEKGKYDQKEGVPPAPEDAPPPKRVWDWDQAQRERQQWNEFQMPWQFVEMAKSWGKGKSSWQPSKSWEKPQAKTWEKKPAAAAAKPAVAQATKGVAKGAAKAGTVAGPAVTKPGIRPAQTVPAKPGFGAKGAAGAGKVVNGKGAAAATKGGLKGNAGSAADRSRTPPPIKAKPDALPPNWEEHFSEEYGIPYFWNAATSESSWERPT